MSDRTHIRYSPTDLSFILRSSFVHPSFFNERSTKDPRIIPSSGVGKLRTSLNVIIGNGKRFIGYEIIKRLNAQKQHSVLTILSEAVDPAERKRNKQHEVWQGTFDVKGCRTEAFIWQKLNYMHLNPCNERWRSLKSPVIMSTAPQHFTNSANKEQFQ